MKKTRLKQQLPKLKIPQTQQTMCPLRVILIFLSATLAGFFVLRNIKSSETTEPKNTQQSSDDDNVNQSLKVGSALKSGFWTCVDMASGRYLWRNLVSAKSAKLSD